MRILWFSRHAPTDEQIKELKRLFGDVEIVQVSKTVNSAQEIIGLMKLHGCEEIVAVLPINLYADLIKKGIKPIRAVMNRILRDDGTVEFKFMHFERIHDIKIVTEKL